MTILAWIGIGEALMLMAAGIWIWELSSRLDAAILDAIEARARYYILRTQVEDLRDQLKEESK